MAKAISKKSVITIRKLIQEDVMPDTISRVTDLPDEVVKDVTALMAAVNKSEWRRVLEMLRNKAIRKEWIGWVAEIYETPIPNMIGVQIDAILNNRETPIPDPEPEKPPETAQVPDHWEEEKVLLGQILHELRQHNELLEQLYGSMGADWSYTGAVTYTMCHADGTYYTNVTKSGTEPENPSGGDIWIDITDDTVKEYSSWTQTWIVLETVYTRVDFLTMGQLPSAFKEYDGVEISGMYFDDLNGSKILYAVDGDPTTTYDYIVLVGIQETTFTQTGASIRIQRKVPDMDFVCEAQNRLWGCFYGNDGTQNLNEIYCCALGDFRNWSQYLGISTDSWRASRGSDGPWTGCVNYLGIPTFFKENIIHPVSVSSVGAHQIGDIPARGVQQGSHKSLAVVRETLYYKSRTGIMAYQGGMPAEVSDALGDERYYNAVAGVFGERYYISMKDTSQEWQFFVFDAQKGLWMHEDGLHVECFTAWGDELYAQVNNKILALNGTEGTLENKVSWAAETGIIHYEQTVRGYGTQEVRYISRFHFRLNMSRDASVTMYIEYDSSGLWQFAGNVKVPVTGAVTVPVRPRRCDHFRLRLEGQDDVKIYSIAKILGKGSDV